MKKTFVKDIKKELNIWRTILCSQIGRLNIVISVLPLIYKFSTLQADSKGFVESQKAQNKYFNIEEELISKTDTT